MIALDISYEGRGINVQGGTRISAQYESEVVDILKGQLVLVSKQLLKTEQDSGDFPRKDFITLVDNKLNSNERDVKPFGVIEYQTKLENLKPVLIFAARAIFNRSPLRTGAYQDNNVLFKNNKSVAAGYLNIVSYIEKERDFKPTDVFRFVNVSPYARKLERYRVTRSSSGTSRVGGLKQKQVKNKLVTVPAGTYVLSTRSIRRKFKALKNNIRFSYIPIEPSTVRTLDVSGKDTTGYVFAKNRDNGRGAGRPYLYPSLTISATSSAVTFNRGFTESSNL
jgi:hypothetical protein